MTDILHVLHVAIQVSDLERADQFYSEVIGLTKVERNLSFAGSWYQVGDFQLHLIVSDWAQNLEREDKWGRHPHLTFAIKGLDGVKRSLTEQQIPFQMSSSGRAALFIKDPDGNTVELLEISD